VSISATISPQVNLPSLARPGQPLGPTAYKWPGRQTGRTTHEMTTINENGHSTSYPYACKHPPVYEGLGGLVHASGGGDRARLRSMNEGLTHMSLRWVA
jgi:hypothetical protein